MKLILIPNDIKNLDKYIKDGCQGIIVGLDKLTTNFSCQMSVEEIADLRNKYPDIEIFVSINKNIFNEELNLLEKQLEKLNEIAINGVLFYDLSVLYLRNKNRLSLNLIWNQTHMVTNYNTCNYYYDLGVKYGFLATEITLDEINEINTKTEMKLFAFAYGYPTIAHTRRKLLTNYFLNKKKQYNGKVCHICDDNNHFIVNENATGTTILNRDFINGSCLITNSDVEYVVFSNYMIDEELTFKLISLIRSLIDTKDERFVKEIANLIGENTNFFFKKTIFMVKKNEE